MDISGNMREYVKDNFDCLKVLTQENRERLEENMYYRTFPKGQILFNDGDLRDRIFVLCSGLIRIEKNDQTDSFFYTDFISEGELFPVNGLFEAACYDFSAIAVTEIEVAYVATAVLEQLMVADRELLKMIVKKQGRVLEQQVTRMQYCITSSAHDRVINTLAILMKKHGKPDESWYIPYPIMINDLAKFSGTTRETVSQVLKQLIKQKKISYQYKELIFIDDAFFQLDE
ncbi:Crp/Fnr family transcriptional regulator [Enterococcus gallinarum]|uniref:Crp/Fnr family transcriptional regulator n=1 Tax=Enterococcus gallinarum TaxID=1353 RepID=UPI00214BF263|nr:Crp/Fnr family transcriptional regulator [Enterococcus gallinarum]MCR1927203.1 Crp/Fnr family transcriptional regulator [Enterococcus gallinarum]